ncbi:MAG: porin [Nitrospirae bacterium]|nr:porin [Nitrospirota bacterium]
MWNSRWFVMAGALGSAIMGFAPPARSEEQSPKATTEERIEVLDQRLRIVERKQENEKEAAAEAAKKAGLVGAGSDGFFLKAPDGSYQFKLRGYIQSDARLFFGDEDKSDVNTFVLRRVRPSFEGTVSKWFDFRFLPDWGNGQAAVQEAYLDIGYWPWAKLRAGKFKAPFDLERLQSGTDIVFVERGFPTSIGPNRDIGLQLSGDLSGGAASYALGVFNGVVDGGSGDGDNHDAKDLVGRVFAHPFRNTSVWAAQGLGLGAAVTYGNQQGKSGSANLPTYKTPGQATFFSYGSEVLAGGTRSRLEPQAYYYWRSLSLATEYARSSQEVKKAETHVTLKNDAFQAAATLFLTGEDAGFKAPKIKRPFDPPGGGWGALELAARYHFLRVDQAAFPDFADPAKSARSAIALAGGLNWHLNKNIKLVFDYEQTRFTGGAKDRKDRESEKVVLNRFQVAF